MSRAVIDQPGVRVVFIGFALSVFLGLALRSQISDSRVQYHVNQAVERLQPDFHVDYESARVTLSNWGLPLPALVINHIRLSPKVNRCQSSQIYADQLEVPLAFSMFFGSTATIPKIRFKQLELRLVDLQHCLEPQQSLELLKKSEPKQPAVDVAPTEPALLSQSPMTAETVQPQKIFANSRSELREVYIERLKVVSDQRPDQPLLLKQVNVDISYTENQLSQISVQSKLSALKDSRTDLYYLNSDLSAHFKLLSPSEIESTLSVDGKLLDGLVRFFVHSYSSSKKISYELDLNQVSYKALLPVLKNTQVLALFDKTPIALSLRNRGEIMFENGLRVDAKLTDFQTYIENGSVKIPDVSLIYQNNHLRFLPFNVEFENFPLTKAKNVESLKQALESIDSLGAFTGQLTVLNERNLMAKGQVKGMSAIFSNRGRRDLQKIDQIDLSFSRKESEIKIVASQFRINDEKNAGRLELRHNTNTLATYGQFKITGAVLNAEVWEQFSYVEQTPRISLDWNYKKEKSIEQHDVQLDFDKVSMPGVHFDELSLNLRQVSQPEKNKAQLTVNIRPASFVTDESFYNHPIVAQLLPEEWLASKAVFGSQKLNILLTGDSWQELNFNLDAGLFVTGMGRNEVKLDFSGRMSYSQGLNSVLSLQGRQLKRQFNLYSTPESAISVKEIN